MSQPVDGDGNGRRPSRRLGKVLAMAIFLLLAFLVPTGSVWGQDERQEIEDALGEARKIRSARDFARAHELLTGALEGARQGGFLDLEVRVLLEETALRGTAGQREAALEPVHLALERVRDPRHPDLLGSELEGKVHTRLAEVWNLLGQPKAADAALAEAAQIYARLGDRRSMADIALKRSTFSNHRGKYSQALELGLQALEHLEGRSQLSALSNVAYSQHKLGQLKEAEKTYDRIVERAWQMSDQGSLDFAFCNRAEVRWMLGEPRPALNDLQRAIDGLESARASIHSSTHDRARFLEKQTAAFDRLVRFRADSNQPVAAFEAAERFHGRSLVETLVPTVDKASFFPAVSPSTAQEARTGLRPGEVLIAYWVSDQRIFAWALDRERLQQVLIPVGRQALEASLSAYLRPLRSGVAAEDLASARPSTGLDPADSADARHLELGRRLYDWLIDPLPDWAKAARQWIVVPDGPLHYLPFAALPEDCGSVSKPDPSAALHQTYAHCRFLGFEKALSRAPSAGVILALRSRAGRRPPPPRPLLAMAPDFSPPAPGGQNGPQNIQSGIPNPDFSSWGPLEHNRDEARQITQGIDGSRLSLDDDATEALLKAEAGKYRWLHLASHGRMDDDDPLGSGILLGAGDGDDGLLRIEEVLQLDLRSDLVTLSACRSGRGELRRGEGIRGLGQAFLSAGASTLVLSLWDVDDRSTPKLMRAFYQRLADGDSPAEALRSARRDLAASFEERRLVFRTHRTSLAHPRFWAGFVVLGGG